MTEERLNKITQMCDHVEIDDIIYAKEQILQVLYNDSDLLEVLDNKQLKDNNAIPEDYHNVCIFSFLKIPYIQSKVQNYICFDVNDIEPAYYNNVMMTKQVIFRCVSHEKSVDTEYGIDRQDLLGYLVKDNFQWSNKCGFQMKKTYDAGRIAENGYYYREIHFAMTQPTGLKNGTTNGR